MFVHIVDIQEALAIIDVFPGVCPRVEAVASRAGIPGSRPAQSKNKLGWCGPGRGCYIGAVTRTGVRFRGVSVTDVCQ